MPDRSARASTRARVEAILAAIEAAIGSRPVIDEARGLASVQHLALAEGRPVTLKADARAPADQYAAEADGLRALRRIGTLGTPEVLAVGEDPPFLLIETVLAGRPGPGFAEELGRGLAELHRGGRGARYGWHRDNYLGATPQPNPWSGEWIGFFAEQRLGFQVRRLRQGSSAGEHSTLVGQCERLIERLHELLEAPAEPPMLVHGDLWAGNVLCDRDGRPILIDPACYFASREVELGMMVLFGAFPEATYRAYDHAYPLADGWRRRIEVYELYHLLNHVNLFGRSYLPSALRRTQSLLRG